MLILVEEIKKRKKICIHMMRIMFIIYKLNCDDDEKTNEGYINCGDDMVIYVVKHMILILHMMMMIMWYLP